MALPPTITEQLILIALDNETRTLTEALDLRLGYGIAGALMMDLAWADAFSVGSEGCAVTPSVSTLPDFLARAHQVLAELGETLTRKRAFDALYSNMPELKAMLLERLTESGYLKRETAKLKWSFALRAYRLKPDVVGIKSKKMKALATDKLEARDMVLLQLARAARLLWGGAGDKKKVPAAHRRLEAVASLMGTVADVASIVEERLPDALMDPTKLLGRMDAKRNYPCVWEWRGFWPQKEGAKLIQASEVYLQPLGNGEVDELEDEYLIIDGRQDNIKLRKNGLEVKRPVASYQDYQAFLPKVIFKFPLQASDMAEIFPRLEGHEVLVENADALKALLAETEYHPRSVTVKKKRMQFKLNSQVRIEFSTIALNANGQKFLTACIEGPDYDITHAHSHNMKAGGAMVMGYVDFLKQYGLEKA